MQYLHYKVIRQLGEGGMGKVLLAEDTMLEKKVALKVLSPELSRSAEFIERFKREAKIQSKLTHPNITTLYNLLYANETYFIVMEYAEGITLQELIQKTGPIPETRALNIFEQIYSALTYAHKSGIIHRDIKPGNIMISEKDEVKIMDFGIAKLLGERNITRTNIKMGSLYYMSPEQISTPKDVDYRTDLFSLGIVLFEMVTGKLPYNTDTDSDFEVMNEIVYSPIPNPKEYYPHISEKTVNLIISLTHKNRENREVSYTENKDLTTNKKEEATEKEKTRKFDKGVNSFEVNREEQNNAKRKKRTKQKNIIIASGIILVVLLVTVVYIKIYIEPETKPKNEIKHTSKVTDIDGNVYNTVTIGSQEWMAENLNVEHYRNGDIIPQVENANEWSNLTTGAWCYYGNDPANGKIYGKLYNGYAVNDPRGLAPEGWHIPKDEEWKQLTDYLGGIKVAGGKLKAKSFWASPNTDATNESGFNALPGDYRTSYSGFFQDISNFVCFWSGTNKYKGFNWFRALESKTSNFERDYSSKSLGYSIRCIRD